MQEHVHKNTSYSNTQESNAHWHMHTYSLLWFDFYTDMTWIQLIQDEDGKIAFGFRLCQQCCHYFKVAQKWEL